jgi:hypothetical protein
MELLSHFAVARELQYTENTDVAGVEAEIADVGKMLNGWSLIPRP